jgi:hypothetical protein
MRRGQPLGRLSAPPRPGLFAEKAEKQLYKALIVKQDMTRLGQIAAEHLAWLPLCAALEGLFAYQAKDMERAESALTSAFQSGQDVASHSFVRRYVGESTVMLEVAGPRRGDDASGPGSGRFDAGRTPVGVRTTWPRSSAGPSGPELSHSVVPPSEGMCGRSNTVI